MGKATVSDSAAMKTVAFITMTFIPATFVSVSQESFVLFRFCSSTIMQAIFSMSFFNFSPAKDNQPEAWEVSDKIWIYWLTAIPLTLLTLSAWVLWHYRGSVSTRDLVLRMMRFRRLQGGEPEKYA